MVCSGNTLVFTVHCRSLSLLLLLFYCYCYCSVYLFRHIDIVIVMSGPCAGRFAFCLWVFTVQYNMI